MDNAEKAHRRIPTSPLLTDISINGTPENRISSEEESKKYTEKLEISKKEYSLVPQRMRLVLCFCALGSSVDTEVHRRSFDFHDR